ncbi:MAG: DUF502 domain-containing protein [Halofilum sp. (in: g-proteobacteria)]|nr:DUF502 domain-containing protein [Halofilum sp. (in: g-proteobacteria)]
MTGSRRQALIDYCWRTFLAGLATVLPIALTAYVIIWLAGVAESVFGVMARFVLPEGWYLPGIGVVMGVALVFLVGVFINAWIVSGLIAFGERLLERIPLVKTLYGGLRDLSRFLSRDSGDSELKHVVSVEVQPDVHLIGFVTDDEAAQALPELARHEDDRLVSVYLPMGYQVGGYTLYLPVSRLKTLDLRVDEAMRMVLTAGVNRPERAEPARSGN